MTTETEGTTWKKIGAFLDDNPFWIGLACMGVGIWVFIPLIVITWFNLFTVSMILTAIILFIISFYFFDQ